MRGVSVLFEPDGIPFQKSVRVLVPVSQTINAGYKNVVYKYDPATKSWLAREDSNPLATTPSSLVKSRVCRL